MPGANWVLIENEKLSQLSAGMNIFRRRRLMNYFRSFSWPSDSIAASIESFSHPVEIGTFSVDAAVNGIFFWRHVR